MLRHELSKDEIEMLEFALLMAARGIESKQRFADKAPAHAYQFRDLAERFQRSDVAYIETAE